MEENTTQPSLVNSAVKNGLILGVISILLVLVIYLIDYTILVELKMMLLSLVISLGYAVYAGINYRKEIGGFISFGKAFQHGFLTFAISGILYTVFSIVLYHVIDTELPAKLTEASLANTEAMMTGFGMPEDQLEEAMEKARESTAGQFTVGKQVMGYGFALIFYAIIALISGAIVKKNQPVAF